MMLVFLLIVSLVNIQLTLQQQTTNPCLTSEDGYFAHDTDLGRYIQCDNGRMVVRDCPVGLIWDAGLRHCGYPSQITSGRLNGVHRLANGQLVLPSQRTLQPVQQQRSVQAQQPQQQQRLVQVEQPQQLQQQRLVQVEQSPPQLRNFQVKQPQQQQRVLQAPQQQVQRIETPVLEQPRILPQPTQEQLLQSNAQIQPVVSEQTQGQSSVDSSLQTLLGLNNNGLSPELAMRLQKLVTESQQANGMVQRPTVQQPVQPVQPMQPPVVQPMQPSVVQQQQQSLRVGQFSRVLNIDSCATLKCPPGHDCVTKNDCVDCLPFCNPVSNVLTSRLVRPDCSMVNCPSGMRCLPDGTSLKCVA